MLTSTLHSPCSSSLLFIYTRPILRYKSLIPAHTLRKLTQELKLLHQSGSLPFADSVNWHLEADFDYEQQFPNSDDDGDRPLNLDRPRWVSPSWDGVGQRVVVE